MKDELGGQIMKEFPGLRWKTYSWLKDNNNEDRKPKGSKSVSSKKLRFQDYKNCLEAAEIGNKINHSAKNKFDVDGFIKQD